MRRIFTIVLVTSFLLTGCSSKPSQDDIVIGEDKVEIIMGCRYMGLIVDSLRFTLDEDMLFNIYLMDEEKYDEPYIKSTDGYYLNKSEEYEGIFEVTPNGENYISSYLFLGRNAKDFKEYWLGIGDTPEEAQKKGTSRTYVCKFIDEV